MVSIILKWLEKEEVEILIYNILVVEDDEDIIKLLKIYLEGDDYRVISAENGIDALKIIENIKVDLVVMDIMMPKMDGYELTKKIREKYTIPIIILSAKNKDSDKIYGLNLGADDYIKKPFSIMELRARIDAHLRREYREKQQVLSTNGLKFNLKSKEIYFYDKKISLTKSEYQICEYLAKHRGQVFSLEQIFIEVYGYDKDSDNSCIREHIKNIRAKITKYVENPIETVWGIGYKWI